MEKKQYIEPSMIVRCVNAIVMQTTSPGGNDEVGDQNQLSKDNFISDEGDSQNGLSNHDIWED